MKSAVSAEKALTNAMTPPIVWATRGGLRKWLPSRTQLAVATTKKKPASEKRKRLRAEKKCPLPGIDLTRVLGNEHRAHQVERTGKRQNEKEGKKIPFQLMTD